MAYTSHMRDGAETTHSNYQSGDSNINGRIQYIRVVNSQG